MRIVFVIGVIAVSLSAMGQTVFDVSMDGAQVPTPSTFTGSGTVTLNLAETQFTVALTHDIPNGNVTMAHIHVGAVGFDGGIIFPFSSGASPINEVIPISPAQVTIMKAEGYYVNIHTNAFPSGEIRGQIVNQPVVPPAGLPAATSWKLIALAGALVVTAGFVVMRRRTAAARVTR